MLASDVSALTAKFLVAVALAVFAYRAIHDDADAGGSNSGRWSGLCRFVRSDTGDVYEGEWADGRQSGFGMQWASDGTLLHCGRWADGKLVEQRLVPRSKILVGTFLSAAARAADPARTLLLSSGRHFVGDFNAEFRPHGEGVEFRADGFELASGQWRDGTQHGPGKWTDPSGERFEGQFVDGEMSGLGAYTWPGGGVFEGEWAHNRRNGLGVVWDKKGKVDKCGRWADHHLVESCAVPRSKIPIGARLSAAARSADVICPGGGFYCGAVGPNHQPHGLGTLHRADGSAAIRGDWTNGRLMVDGARDAAGRLQGAASEWTAVGLFEGNFVDGRRSGLGVQWDTAGKVVGCGRWANGQLVEQRPVPRSKFPVGVSLSAQAKDAPLERTLLMPDGGHYVGEFGAEFRPHGEGTQYRADGSELASGQWRDGKQHGRGKTFHDGDRYEGEFVTGQMSGLGAFTWADGLVFEGEFRENHYGLGVEWTADGKMLNCGRWADDELVESRSVPRSKIPVGKFLSAAAKESALLFPDGGFYRGEINAQLQRHGAGSMHAADGAVLSGGVWRADRLLTGAEVTALAVAAHSPSAATGPSSAPAPDAASAAPPIAA